MLLYVHKDLADNIDMTVVANTWGTTRQLGQFLKPVFKTMN